MNQIAPLLLKVNTAASAIPSSTTADQFLEKSTLTLTYIKGLTRLMA